MRVVVVGAGIVGAAVAYELSRAGAEVVLLEKSLPASGVTGDSFAWIGGPRAGDVPDGSTPLRRRVLADYRRLEREVPGVQVHWHGSLRWGDSDPDERLRLGPEESLLDASGVRRLEPRLGQPPSRAVYRTTDGAVDPVSVTHALIRAAGEHGARLRVTTAATGLRVEAGQVVGADTTAGFVPSDAAVVTAGADAPLLCAPLGFDLPVAPSPALLMRFTGPLGLVRTLVATPEYEVRQTPDGLLLVAAEYAGETSPDDLDRAGLAMLERLRAGFEGAQDVRLHSVRLGARPMPADGVPIIGALADVTGVTGAYVAVMHSGITLAPAVARLVAPEITRGTRAEELEHVRPGRFPAHRVRG